MIGEKWQKNNQKPSWTQWIPYIGLYQILRAQAKGEPHICDGLDLPRELVEGRMVTERDVGKMRLITSTNISPKEVLERTNAYKYNPKQYFGAVLYHAATLVPHFIAAMEIARHSLESLVK